MRNPRFWLVGLTAAVAAVVAVVVIADSGGVDATTSTAPGPEQQPSPPSDLRRVLWTRTFPGDVRVGADGGFVAVKVEDGVRVLDGRTGRERWHYLAADREATMLAAGGGRVAVVLKEDDVGGLNAPDPRASAYVFDLATGRLQVRFPVAYADAHLVLTADSVLAQDGPEDRIRAFTGRSSRPVWSRAVQVCAAGESRLVEMNAVDGVAVFAVNCTRNEEPVWSVLVAVDVHTGATRWQRRTRPIIRMSGRGPIRQVIHDVGDDFTMTPVDVATGKDAGPSIPGADLYLAGSKDIEDRDVEADAMGMVSIGRYWCVASGDVRCFDVSTGRRTRLRFVAPRHAYDLPHLAMAGNRLLIASGNLFQVMRPDGHVESTGPLPVNADDYAGFLPGPGTLVLVSGSGYRLVALGP